MATATTSPPPPTRPSPAAGAARGVSLPVLAAPAVDLAFVDETIARLGQGPEAAIPILQALQAHYHWLPEAALRRVVEATDVTAAQMAGVATFYAQFRHKPAGEHIIRVCHGTACHVKGAELVDDALRRELKLPPGADTDAAGKYTLERVGCLGCCTLAPVVQIDTTTFGHLTAQNAPAVLHELGNARAGGGNGHSHEAGGDIEGEIRIGVGSCCIAGGSMAVKEELEQTVHLLGSRARVKTVGCVGMCHQTPLVEVTWHGGEIAQPSVLYTKVGREEAAAIVRRHFAPRGVWRRLRAAALTGLDRLVAEEPPKPLVQRAARDGPICEFLGRQQRIATEYCGHLNPLDIDEYERHEGFAGLRAALAMTPEALIGAVTRSGLRGRGGAGFTTGRKWALTRGAKGTLKYIVCNGDEGDPGAFMDRMILESYPYRVLEGMAIAARAIGAEDGYLYIRAEYPLAVERIRAAIKVCQERGILGDDVLGSGKALRLKVYEGAGAFVCGEETALIQSIEGQRGMPQLRPPYPAEEGLWGKPTNINNVETFAMVPWIVRHGWEEFARIGTEKSKGTKVFALTGKVRRGGLIEVPMGISIREIVEEIGGGVADAAPGEGELNGKRRFKAVQIGGPSGGCIPAEMADTSVDYESLAKVGAIMGSGGLVVMDDRDCMVDIARYFLHFTQAESCGKCTMCRIGTKRMLEILDRLCEGKARGTDLRQLEELSQSVKIGSLCGLGQTAPNPVLSTLRYFREEYEAHLKGHCPAGKCKALISYEVGDGCIGCTKCAQDCPAGAIPFTPYKVHTIDAALCTRCDVCRQICPTHAIAVR